jgi:hypothetical protein
MEGAGSDRRKTDNFLVARPTRGGTAAQRAGLLTPLKGVPLEDLTLPSGTRVEDLTLLSGMPLSSLLLMNCSKVRDLTPLRGMPLTRLSEPPSP